MSKIKLLFICHGNICRSTMAQSVMQYLVERRGLSHSFQIDSAATSREEIGNPVHPGTVRKLQKENIPVIPRRAVQMKASDYEEYDYLIGMDSANLRNMRRIVGDDPEKKCFFYWSLPVRRAISPIRGIPGILKIRIGMCVGGAKDSWFILDCPRNCPHPSPRPRSCNYLQNVGATTYKKLLQFYEKNACKNYSPLA